MSRSRWGGFRKGRQRYLEKWIDLRTDKAVSESITETPAVTEFDYTTAQGIWNLNSTVQFKKGNTSSGGSGGPTLSSNVLLYAPFYPQNNGSTTAAAYYLSGVNHILDSQAFVSAGGAQTVTSGFTEKMTGASSAAYSPGNSGDGWTLNSTISNNIEVGSSSPISIEFWWFNNQSLSRSYGRLFSWGGYFDSGSGFEIESNGTSTTSYIFYEFKGLQANRRTVGTYTLNSGWNHIYWASPTNGNGTSYVGINGTIYTFGTYLTGFNPASESLSLGTADGTNTYNSGGYWQELIVRNTIPYTSNFTPSTTPLL